jgi:vacuolar protein sorting-associated protein 13A/C
MVYLSPRYCAVNDTEGELLISDSETVYSLAPGAQVPVHFNPSNTETINVRLTSNPDWSSSFDIKNAGKIYLRESKLKQLFRVARVIQSPNLFISFSLTDSWPFTFRNQSSSDITIQQKNVDQQYSCPTKSELKYSWDQPSFSDKRLIMTVNGKEFNIDLSEVGKKTNLKVKPGEGPGMSLNLEIKAEGPMVVVLIKDRKSKDSEGEDATLQQQEYVESFQDVILVRLPFIAVSLIGSELEEFLLVYVKDLELRYAISKQFTSYGVTIKWLQIDNQSFDWDHPMMLYPAVINKSAKELEEHPFLSLGIIQSRDTSYGVTYFKYFGLLLQEMSIEVGEELLRRLLNFGNFSLLTVQPRTIVTEKDYSIQHYQVGRDSSEVLFFEFFQMHPIKLNLTFSRTEDTEAARKKQISYNPLTTLLDVFTMTIGNISEAPLKFNALVLENILSRKDSLEETVMEHYKQEGLSQIHKVLGSADFLGNPVGLVSTLGSGVTDLFYEPYQGFVSDRPQDIGIGFARGGLSLVKKTVSGVTGTLSKFTGSLAKGLSAATMDKSYQQKRRMDRAKNKPKHALSGVSTGVLQLYSGFKSGITGVVDKPMEGAKEGGVGGFFKGVGVGLVGIVTKPVVGLIDMTTSLSEGIKSSAEDEQNEVTQARFPRVVPYDGKIRVYDEREAFGQSIMANVLGVEKVGSEFYISHLDVPGDNSIVILTSQRLLYISLDRIKSLWQIDNDTITDVKATTDCILVSVAGGSPRTKIIPIIDVGSQKWFVQQIKDCCSCL